LANIRLILRKNTFPEHKAGLLGENLRISYGIIKTLRHDSNNDSNQFFSEVINHWLHNDRSKSWGKLADAIEQCDYADVADDIRDIYVKSITVEHQPHGSGK